MPFKSKAQLRYMFKNHPKIAERFVKETKNIRGLPQHVKKTKRVVSRKRKMKK